MTWFHKKRLAKEKGLGERIMEVSISPDCVDDGLTRSLAELYIRNALNSGKDIRFPSLNLRLRSQPVGGYTAGYRTSVEPCGINPRDCDQRNMDILKYW